MVQFEDRPKTDFIISFNQSKQLLLRLPMIIVMATAAAAMMVVTMLLPLLPLFQLTALNDARDAVATAAAACNEFRNLKDSLKNLNWLRAIWCCQKSSHTVTHKNPSKKYQTKKIPHSFSSLKWWYTKSFGLLCNVHTVLLWLTI